MIALPDPIRNPERGEPPKCWAPRGHVQFTHAYLGEIVQSGLSRGAILLLLAILDEVLGWAGRGPSTSSGQGFWAKKTGLRKKDMHRHFTELHAAAWIHWQPGNAKVLGTATLLRLPPKDALPAGRGNLHQDTGNTCPQNAGTPTRKERAELPADCGQKCPQSAGTIKKKNKESLFKKPAGAKSNRKPRATGTSYAERLVPPPQVQEQQAPEPVQIAEASTPPTPAPPPPPKDEKPRFPKPSAGERARWTAAIDQVATQARRSDSWQESAAGLELLAWGAEVHAWHSGEGAGRRAGENYGTHILDALRAADPTVSKFTVHTPGGAVSVEPKPAEAAA